MATNFPGALDDGTTLPNPGANSPTNNPSHAQEHDNENDAIKAIQAKVGTGASTPVANRVFRGTGTGTSAWAQLVLTTDVSGVLPVANGGTGLSSLTLPASGTVAGTTDAQDVTNKTLHDTFMGTVFNSQSATFRNVLLDASVNYIVTELLEVGAAFTFEIPATSTLEIKAFHGTQSFADAQHNHQNAAGGGLITPQAISNPYKFSVYRNAAANTGSGAFALIAFDTKLFDTGTNVSGGVFTAPVTGFYQFNWSASATSGAAELFVTSLHVNGVRYCDGSLLKTSAGALDMGSAGATTVSMNIGDTADVRSYDSVGARALNTGQNANGFSGFFVSAT